MKNYIIGTLLVVLLVLSSIQYKNLKTPIFFDFPIPKESLSSNIDAPLYLFVFFSKRNCIDCMEFIRELNHLPPQFVVIGVVPEKELKNQDELKELTGANFSLVSAKKFRKYIPSYTPALIGVSPGRKIVFVLAGVPGEKEYLKNYLSSLYLKLSPTF